MKKQLIAYCKLPTAYCLLLTAYCLLTSNHCLANSDVIQTSGEIISRGSIPHTDTWQEMLTHSTKEIEVECAPMPLNQKIISRAENTETPILLNNVYSSPGALAPQTFGAQFDAIDYTDFGWYPPDTMGAVGPSHFMEVINGSVSIYTRAGSQLSAVTLTTFFTFNLNGTNYPRGNAFDPRVIYDRRSSRWFASTLEFGNPLYEDNHIILAVSRTGDPTATWDKYLIPCGVPTSGIFTYFSDYETLAVDDNGVYLGVRIFPNIGSWYAKIIATAKAPLISPSPSLSNVYQWSNITDMYSTPQPAHNHDTVGGAARAWFVASSDSVYANLKYRRLTWSGGVPSLDGSSGTITTPAFDYPINAPANGSSTDINVGDMRAQMAVIRNNRLWTCRNVGVNSSGGSSSADRTGCEWFELDVSSATPSVLQNGRVYDSTPTNPRFYYYPSIMVNGQGHAAMGFSGSKSSEYIGSYTCGRLVTDPINTMGAVTQIIAGTASYLLLDNSSRNRWGDYSYTSLDPNNDMSLWTIQEYAKSPVNTWGTYVAELLSPPPILVNPNTNGAPGQTGFVLELSGNGFYDPGAGYSNRLDVVLTGGAVNGISNYGISYISPTNLLVSFDIATNASSGHRNIALTNPDGQPAVAVNGFWIIPEPCYLLLIYYFGLWIIYSRRPLGQGSSLSL